MELIDKELLDEVSQQAKENSRLRMNYNFHKSLDAPVQRLLNALEPGTELPIHKHPDTDETYILLRGKLRVLFYNNKKELLESFVLSPKEDVFGINIPAGQFHTIEILEPKTVIFEVKEGPYTPLEGDNILK